MLPDGRIGTVVYHGLDGYGIQWGEVIVDEAILKSVNPLFGEEIEDYPYVPQAMLRDPYKNADVECVGSDYNIVTPLTNQQSS